jgi:DNA-binding response OmpR family regulator
VARSQSSSNPVRVSFDKFDLDEANACLLRNGEAVALAPTPFNLLCELARQPGALLTKTPSFTICSTRSRLPSAFWTCATIMVAQARAARTP